MRAALSVALFIRKHPQFGRKWDERNDMEKIAAKLIAALATQNTPSTKHMNELLVLALVAVVGAVLCVVQPPVVKKDAVFARRHMLLGGLLLAGTDFLVEFFGTHQGGWHYNKSLWFVTGTIPVELLVLFFCCGVWMAALHLIFRSHTVVPPAVAGSVLLAVAVYGLVVRHTVLNLPFALWGFCQLDSEPKRSSTILLATATALADWLVETWAIGAGNYAYAEVFTYEIPLSYAMLVMGFVGLLESAANGQQHGHKA